MRTKSLNFNPRNRFITSTCEYCVALVKFNEAKKTKDSLTKVTLLDSSRMFLNLSRASMRRSGINTGLNFIYQKEKNMHKVQALMDENNRHSAFIRNRIVQTTKETRNIKELRDEMDVFTKKIFRRTFSLRFLAKGNKNYATKIPNEKVAQDLKVKHALLNAMADSLNIELQNMKAGFDNNLIPLNKSILQHVGLYDSLLEPIKKSIDLRGQLYDNYKKIIVETRKPLDQLEQLYQNNTDSSMDLAGYRMLQSARAIFNLIDRRNKIIGESYKTKTQLIKFGLLEPKKLDEFEDYVQTLNDDDFCWLRGKNTAYLTAIFKGFNQLQQAQKYFEWNIRKENRTEGMRSRFVGAEITRRRKKHSGILEHNRWVVFRKANQVKDYKRRYLNKLKKEAKKQKRKAKKET